MNTVLVRFAIAALVAALSPSAFSQTEKPASPQKTGEIRGTVSYCGPSGTVGVEVYIPGESSQARVKPSGEFTLRFLPPGNYNVVVEIPGRTPFTIEGVSVSDNVISDLGTTLICRDVDGDGYSEETDCNDNNPGVNPAAVEACDGVDNNCDQIVDEGCALCTDDDGDGFFAQMGCTTLVDCDDSDPLTSPVGVELCDNRDNDCDLLTDESIDTESDPSNCGECGNVCSFPNAGGICAGGSCEIGACTNLFGNCNGDPADGCETNLGGDLNNCGGCGIVCSGPGVVACQAGTCVVQAECNEGEVILCGSDIGACESGLQFCSNGTWMDCTGGVGPSPELCGNDIDEDCDGQVDEPGCTSPD